VAGGLSRTSKNVRDVYLKKKQLGTSGLGRLGDVFKRNDDKLRGLVDMCKR
jgi:hypothetical protein